MLPINGAIPGTFTRQVTAGIEPMMIKMPLRLHPQGHDRSTVQERSIGHTQMFCIHTNNSVTPTSDIMHMHNSMLSVYEAKMVKACLIAMYYRK